MSGTPWDQRGQSVAHQVNVTPDDPPGRWVPGTGDAIDYVVGGRVRGGIIPRIRRWDADDPYVVWDTYRYGRDVPIARGALHAREAAAALLAHLAGEDP